MEEPAKSDPATARPGVVGKGPASSLPETMRFVYLVFLPVAGLVAAVSGGAEIGRGWGFGIAIGLFLYHYLTWALFETEREWIKGSAGGMDWRRWAWVLPPLIVLALSKGDPRHWLIEQTLLEAGAFVAAMGALAMVKCAGEGREAPWLLALAVFVLPSVALLVKLGMIWLERRDGDFGWEGWAFLGAWAMGVAAQYRRLGPFVTGRDQLMEPLTTPGRCALAVVWLFVLLIGGIVVGG